MIEMEVSFDDIADDFQLGVTWEWDLAWEHDVEDDSHGPDIDLLVIALQEYLRCDVVWLYKRVQVKYDSSWLRVKLLTEPLIVFMYC